MTDQEPTRNFSTVEYFSDIIVWGHETIPDIKRDPWISGLTDFISLAHLVC